MANRVQITLPEEDGEALSKLAQEEDRTVAGQARHMLRRALFLAKNEERAHEINAALAEAEYHPPAIPSMSNTARHVPVDSALREPQSEEEHQPVAHQNPTSATSKTLPG